jgi:K+:H+ antiporter
VLVAGFGRVGQTLALLLESRLIPYVALDLDPERVAEARRLGLPVYYGDATRGEVMKSAGIEYAQLAVVTLDQPALAHRAVQMLRALRPELPVLARARDVDQAEALAAAGATSVVPELVEGSLQLGELLLRRVGIGREEAEQVLEEFRDRTYARLSPLISGHPPGAPPAAAPDPDRPREESRSVPPR